LLEKFDVFRSRDLLDLTDQSPPPFDQLHAVFDTKLFKGTARQLHIEQLLDLVRAELGGSIAIALNPANKVGQGGPLVKKLQSFFISRWLAVHARQEPIEREITELTDREPECFGTLAHGRIPQPTLRAIVEDLSNGMSI
jgi:hypothetical protein